MVEAVVARTTLSPSQTAVLCAGTAKCMHYDSIYWRVNATADNGSSSGGLSIGAVDLQIALYPRRVSTALLKGISACTSPISGARDGALGFAFHFVLSTGTWIVHLCVYL